MNDNIRTALGIGLLIVAFFFVNNDEIIPVNPKLEKPDANIVDMVKGFPQEFSFEDVDKNIYSGTFYGMSQELKNTNLPSNLSVSYMLNYVGEKVVQPNKKGSYPEFPNQVAELISKVIGPQSDTGPVTDEEKEMLAKLYYGLAWKLYDKNSETIFDSQSEKTIKAIKKYNGEDEVPDEVEEKCPCEGKGYIIHGDGHRTNCPCKESGQACPHDPKCAGTGQVVTFNVKPADHKCACDSQPGMKCGCFEKYGKCDCPTITTTRSTVAPVTVFPTSSNFSSDCPDGNCPTVKKKYVGAGYPAVPNINRYRPKVGVAGMTVRYHLVNGGGREHNPVNSAYVDSLTLNQQYWLHDYLHGYNR